MAVDTVSPGLLAVGAAGALLLAVVLVDEFVTIFAYDGFTFLTPRFHRAAWASARALTAWLPGRARHAALSLTSALLLPATLVLWLGLETAAFGMLFLPGLAHGDFAVSHHAGTGATTAFYASGGVLTTLAFGDVIPTSGLYRALSDLATVVGLATFTLALTYVLNTFSALENLNRLYSRIRRNAVEPHRPSTILERRFRYGDSAHYSEFLRAVVDELDAYGESLRRFPVAFYFHTRRLERSTPRILGTLGDLIEVSRFGLPPGEPLTTDPNLMALVDQYGETLERLGRSFLPGVPLPLFPRAATADPTPDEEAAFAEVRAEALRASGLTDHSSPDEGASQLREWVAFHRPTTAIIDALSRALGYRGRR